MTEPENPSTLFVVERAIIGIVIVGLVLSGLYYDWLSPYETLTAAIAIYGWLVSRSTLNKVTEGVESAGDCAKPVKGAIEQLVGTKGAIADTLIASVSRVDPKLKESKAKKVGKFLLGALKMYLTGRIG